MNKIVLGIIFLLICCILFFKPFFLKVSSFSLSVQGADCIQSDIRDQIKVSGEDIFSIEGDQILSGLQKKYPCLGSIKVDRSFPNKLSITLYGKKAIATILQEKNIDGELDASSSGQTVIKYFLVDQSGGLFENIESSRSGLPLLYYTNTTDLNVGSNLGNLPKNAVTIVNKLKGLNISSQKVVLQGEDLEVLDGNPQTILFNLNDDVLRELASLQLILQTGKMNSDTSSSKGVPPIMERVDLRFDKPVITYSSQKH